MGSLHRDGILRHLHLCCLAHLLLTHHAIKSVGAQATKANRQVKLPTMNQRLAFKSEVDLLTVSQAKRIIPTGSLPSGILTITVFDAQWQPLAERICFVDNKEYVFPSSSPQLR
jgi:hypothetical protein